MRLLQTWQKHPRGELPLSPSGAERPDEMLKRDRWDKDLALAVSHIQNQSFLNTVTDSDDNLVAIRLRKYRSKVLSPQLLLELITKYTLTWGWCAKDKVIFSTFAIGRLKLSTGVPNRWTHGIMQDKRNISPNSKTILGRDDHEVQRLRSWDPWRFVLQ